MRSGVAVLWAVLLALPGALGAAGAGTAGPGALGAAGAGAAGAGTAGPGALGAAGTGGADAVPGLVMIAEMEPFPELAWPRSAAPELPAPLQAAVERWRTASSRIAARITPEAVRGLSRWARKEMERYQAVPPLAKLTFALVQEDTAQHRALLEGTLDTLPSHSPLVTRWLKVFLVCDTGDGSIVRTVVTIRGQVLE
jgi:hypothetical protein